MRLATAVVLPLSLSACAVSPHVREAASRENGGAGAGGAVAVRVMFRGAALPGSRVEWRPALAQDGIPAIVGMTDDEGIAAFAPPPGPHDLVAQWRRDGDFARPIAPGDRFAYYGMNPVYVAPGPAASTQGSARQIILTLEEFTAPPSEMAASGLSAGIAGIVMSDGDPVAEARVSAYLRSDRGFRQLGFATSAPTAPGGEFFLELPPGRYYLVARKRAAGGMAGPLRKNDFFGYYPANPVTVGAGRAVNVVIPVTLLKLRNSPLYLGDSSTSAYIEGRIVGRDGKPRRGVYAALYFNPDLLDRPVFMSDVTGDDGRYRLPVPVAGTYYLGARQGYGGSPAFGSLYGRYEGSPAHAVSVREGDRLTGIDIIVEEVR